jgi:hypothetical protein
VATIAGFLSMSTLCAQSVSLHHDGVCTKHLFGHLRTMMTRANSLRSREAGSPINVSAHRARRFDPHDDRRRNGGVEFADGLPVVLQRLLDHRAGVAIQHRNRLLARVQIATNQPRLGLLQPERGERGRRTVYADRCEVDVVMTSMFMRVNSMCAHHVRRLKRRLTVCRPSATREDLSKRVRYFVASDSGASAA